jgi:nucleoside-diphosphate-sugar epimerase
LRVRTDVATSPAVAPPDSEVTLEAYLSRPTNGTIGALAEMNGDLLLLGAGGKLGFSLANLARRSLDEALPVSSRSQRRVIAVSRFGDAASRSRFEAAGVEVLASDLLADGALDALPEVPNVLYLVGMKFGSTDDPGMTWAINTHLPALVARRFRRSRIVALSTGNVYPLVDVRSGGSIETDALGPVGEYAQSCLGRERMFQYFSQREGTAVTLVRLNYANDLRYGVLTDIAVKVANREPIDVTTGFVNVIWQGDANAAILQSFSLASTPPAILNVSGPETASVRWLASRLSELLGVPRPTFVGEEAPTALLSNCSKQHALFGYPHVPLDRLLEWTASWVSQGGRLLNKPTHFQTRDGTF